MCKGWGGGAYLWPGYYHRISLKFQHGLSKNMKLIFWWWALKGWKLFGVVFHVPVWWPAPQHVSFMDLRNFCLKNWSISELGAQGYQTEGTSWCGSSNLQLGHIGSRLLIVNNPNLAKDYVHTLVGQGWNNHLAALTPAAALLWFHPRVFRLLPNMSAFSEQYRPTMEGRGGIWWKAGNKRSSVFIRGRSSVRQ